MLNEKDTYTIRIHMSMAGIFDLNLPCPIRALYARPPHLHNPYKRIRVSCVNMCDHIWKKKKDTKIFKDSLNSTVWTKKTVRHPLPWSNLTTQPTHPLLLFLPRARITPRHPFLGFILSKVCWEMKHIIQRNIYFDRTHFLSDGFSLSFPLLP